MTAVPSIAEPIATPTGSLRFQANLSTTANQPQNGIAAPNPWENMIDQNCPCVPAGGMPAISDGLGAPKPIIGDSAARSTVSIYRSSLFSVLLLVSRRSPRRSLLGSAKNVTPATVAIATAATSSLTL